MTSEQLARLCAGIPIEEVPGFTGITPWRPRRAQIDPETRLVRRGATPPMHEGSWADRYAAAQLDREARFAIQRRAKEESRANWP